MYHLVRFILSLVLFDDIFYVVNTKRLKIRHESIMIKNWSQSEAGRWAIPIMVSFAFLCEQIDNGALATAMPAIAEELGRPATQLSSLITIYILALIVVLPISGWLADRFGSKTVFRLALLVFMAGSLGCAISNTFEIMLGFRVVQGVGSALMLPVGRLIILNHFERRELVAAMSLMTAPVLIGPVVGPLLSGLITTHASWRWIFLINVPVAIVGVTLASALLKTEERQKTPRFDWLGWLLLVPVLVLFQLAIEVTTRGGQQVLLWVLPMLLAMVGLAFTYWRRSKRVNHPAVDLGLFRAISFRAGTVFGGLGRTGLNAVPFLLPLHLQLNLGFSPATAGSMIALAIAGAVVIKPLNGRLLQAFGFRRLLAGTLMIAAVLVAGFSAYQHTPSLWLLGGHIIAFGFVRTILFNSFGILTFSEVPQSRRSSSVSLASLIQQLSMGMGVSLGALVLSATSMNGQPDFSSFGWAFVAAGLVVVLAALLFRTMPPTTGDIVLAKEQTTSN